MFCLVGDRNPAFVLNGNSSSTVAGFDSSACLYSPHAPHCTIKTVSCRSVMNFACKKLTCEFVTSAELN
jgi:hypothetical protein